MRERWGGGYERECVRVFERKVYDTVLTSARDVIVGLVDAGDA